MATFLALFVVIALPATALTAAGALAPERLARLAPAMTLGAAAAGAAITALGIPLGRLLGLSAGLVVVLGIAVPGSVLLNLDAAWPTAMKSTAASRSACCSSQRCAS